LSEALINARFSLIAAALAEAGLAEERRGPVLLAFERRFRLQQYLGQPEGLRPAIEETGRTPRALAGVRDAAAGILETMRRDAPALYEEGARRRSDFFRDLAGRLSLGGAEE